MLICTCVFTPFPACYLSVCVYPVPGMLSVCVFTPFPACLSVHVRLPRSREGLSVHVRLPRSRPFQVSCGGCHTLVIAKPRVQNGVMSSSEEEFDSSDDEDLTDFNGTVRNSMDLNGTISARNRRREKLPVSPRIIELTIMFCVSWILFWKPICVYVFMRIVQVYFGMYVLWRGWCLLCCMTMTMTMNLFPIYNIYNTHTYNMTIIIK